LTMPSRLLSGCACGPRQRYGCVRSSRTRLLADHQSGDHEADWFIACVFVRPDHQGGGIVLRLVRAAVAAGRVAGTVAVEAWPLARGVRRPREEHVGREGVFVRLGFERIAQPSADRVIMRLDF
jgi:GNAT superfamily N-acetyltransferase